MDKNSTGWISYIKTEKKFNIKLRKHYKKMLVYHEIVCWDECEKDFDCGAISIKNVIDLQDCFFFKTGEISLELNKTWVSFFKSEALKKGAVKIVKKSITSDSMI